MTTQRFYLLTTQRMPDDLLQIIDCERHTDHMARPDLAAIAVAPDRHAAQQIVAALNARATSTQAEQDWVEYHHGSECFFCRAPEPEDPASEDWLAEYNLSSAMTVNGVCPPCVRRLDAPPAEDGR